jgi:hypothetical protein
VQALGELRKLYHLLCASFRRHSSFFVASAAPSAASATCDERLADADAIVERVVAATGTVHLPAVDAARLARSWDHSASLAERCALSLVPLTLPSDDLQTAVEWEGKRFLAPCANFMSHNGFAAGT